MSIDAMLAGFAALAFAALVIYALTSDKDFDDRQDRKTVRKNR